MSKTWRSECSVVLAFCLLTLASEGVVTARAEDSVTVFAAASTSNAVTDIGKLFKKIQGVEILPSFASSSTLAKQIENGAPAHIFVSANPTWMDYLEERKLIDGSSRFDLLGNRIVLIAPADSRWMVELTSEFDLGGLLGDRKLAMGDPDHVPAGMYGKQALQSLKLWDGVEGKVARTKDVRAALALVERGEAPLGVVYATDATISGKVKILGVFPENTHPPIVYPVALVAGNETPAAKSLLKFLKTPEARAVFEKYGFTVRR